MGTAGGVPVWQAVRSNFSENEVHFTAKSGALLADPGRSRL